MLYNKAILTNIRRVHTKMNIQSNTGISTKNMVGELAGYGTVWYHKNGIANILSLTKVSRDHNVKLDSANGNNFEVKKKVKPIIQWTLFFDINKNDKGIAMVTTVEKRMENTQKNL